MRYDTVRLILGDQLTSGRNRTAVPARQTRHDGALLPTDAQAL